MLAWVRFSIWIMTKHRFSYIERYALWKAYDGRCFYCEEPLDFQDMTVDHVVPERYAQHPDELARIRRNYDIDETIPSFQVNDFSNWVPAHPRKCNTRKGAELFPKKMLLLILHEVQRKLPRVREQLRVLQIARGRANMLGSLGAAIEKQHLTIDAVREFLTTLESERRATEPLVLTFGLMIEDLYLDDSSLPPCAPREYAYLCDWLELDLVKHLRSIVKTPFHYTQPSERWGDGLSVRVVFPDLDDASLDSFDRPWWKILEAMSFWDLFGTSYKEAFPDLPLQEYFGNLDPRRLSSAGD